MRFPARPLAAFAALSLLAAGCGDGPTVCPPPAPAAPSETAFRVQQIDFAGLDKLVKSHPGKVLVVDVWSLGCSRCLKKMPYFVALHARLADKGLVVITVTTDEPEDTAKVEEYLKGKGATFPAYLLKDTDANATKNEAVYPTFPQPMMWVYDRAGKRAVYDEGKLKEADIDRKVEELLAAR